VDVLEEGGSGQGGVAVELWGVEEGGDGKKGGGTRSQVRAARAKDCHAEETSPPH
jgi:hypothetical protein